MPAMAEDASRIPRLTGDPDHDINELNRVISLGGNSDSFKRALRVYLKNNVITEPEFIDPRLRDVPEAVFQQIKTLDSYLQMPEFAVDTINIEAVKKAYIDGSLEIRPGYWTCWVAGRQKTGYINTPEAIGPNPHKVFVQWVKEENGHRVWTEEPRDFPQMASDNGNTIDVPVLDDTGSSYLEIFDADRVALNIFPATLHIQRPVILTTVAGPVIQNRVFLEAHILDQANNPIRGWVLINAAAVPDNPNRLRCSGMFVRKSLFTATAPNGQGLLHVARKKNGIVTHLPVV